MSSKRSGGMSWDALDWDWDWDWDCLRLLGLGLLVDGWLHWSDWYWWLVGLNGIEWLNELGLITGNTSFGPGFGLPTSTPNTKSKNNFYDDFDDDEDVDALFDDDDNNNNNNNDGHNTNHSNTTSTVSGPNILLRSDTPKGWNAYLSLQLILHCWSLICWMGSGMGIWESILSRGH